VTATTVLMMKDTVTMKDTVIIKAMTMDGVVVVTTIKDTVDTTIITLVGMSEFAVEAEVADGVASEDAVALLGIIHIHNNNKPKLKLKVNNKPPILLPIMVINKPQPVKAPRTYPLLLLLLLLSVTPPLLSTTPSEEEVGAVASIVEEGVDTALILPT